MSNQTDEVKQKVYEHIEDFKTVFAQRKPPSTTEVDKWKLQFEKEKKKSQELQHKLDEAIIIIAHLKKTSTGTTVTMTDGTTVTTNESAIIKKGDLEIHIEAKKTCRN